MSEQNKDIKIHWNGFIYEVIWNNDKNIELVEKQNLVSFLEKIERGEFH